MAPRPGKCVGWRQAGCLLRTLEGGADECQAELVDLGMIAIGLRDEDRNPGDFAPKPGWMQLGDLESVGEMAERSLGLPMGPY